MAKRIFAVPVFTPTAQADTTALTNQTYMAIGAGSATQQLNILEIFETGQAATSAVNIMCFARHSTLSTTPTALAAPASDGPSQTATAALAAPPLTYTAAATGPQRSAATSTMRLQVGFNAAGGIVRWKPAPGEELSIVGTTVSVSECSLSAFTGGNVGPMAAHIMYEPL